MKQIPVVHKKKKIGVVFKHPEGDWEANSFNSEIGHRGMTKKQAIKDVLDLHEENVRYDRYLRKHGIRRDQ